MLSSRLLKLLSALLPVISALVSLIKTPSKMRRVITADKVSVGVKYFQDDKEVGNVRYNLVEGYFAVSTFPSSFTALRKASEFIRLLSFAVKIIKAELV